MKAKRRWEPLPGPQTDAFNSPAFITLYGGAAGGGKSDLLLGLARYAHTRTLLLRRTFPELNRSLIERSRELWDPRFYNGARHRYTFEDGVSIEFGNLEYENNVHQYQSAQYDLIGFDELTQFTRFQFEYLISRARSTKRGQRVRIVACTNPGGEGNDWVMTLWAPWLDKTHRNPAKPGELRWFKRDEKGAWQEAEAGDPDAISFTFIPASLADNPHLPDDYRRTLNALPEPFRSQLLRGDWTAGLIDDAYQVIPRAWIKAAVERWKPDGYERGEGGKPKYPTVWGCDIARGGDDQTVFCPRRGYWVGEIEAYPGRETPDGQSVVALLAPLLAREEKSLANLDVIGVGSSAYDIARMQNLRVNPVNFSEKSNAFDKSGTLSFVNRRAEDWWRVRELLDPSAEHPMAIPPDPELMADLAAPRWRMQTNGVRIEEKEEIRKRLGRSTDRGDAFVMAFSCEDFLEPRVIWV